MGKSTFFNILSGANIQALNYPFCTIEPNKGVVEVPDARLTKLGHLAGSGRIIPAFVTFVDIAGLVKGASEGEGLGNQFLVNVRETDLIIHVVRCFHGSDVAHVAGSVDPVRDRDVIHTELLLKDLSSIEQQKSKMAKRMKARDKELAKAHALLLRCEEQVQQEREVRHLSCTAEERKTIRSFFLLSDKPVLYLANVDDAYSTASRQMVERLQQAVGADEVIPLRVGLEHQLAEFEGEERQALLESYELSSTCLERIIKASFRSLGLITYFTAGPKETRAWPLLKGSKAPEAAGVIHSDFQRGFICAEVIKYADYIAHGSEAACKDRGKIYTAGKDYEVEDGDIMHFRFNV